MSVQKVKELLVSVLKQGIKVVCYSDDEYPEALRYIDNPPCVIFYRGDINVLNSSRILTVVGTRNPSDYTVAVTNSICHDLVCEDFTIVSGFARGVDSIATKCSVAQHKPVVCVLACGIDVEYPKGNAQLRCDVLECGGVLLTEQLPDDPAYSGNFPKRNRILAGLSQGTLVTEASIKSGALITAEYAYTQDKPVFCVAPHDIFDARYMGVTKFIRDGAITVFSYRDILYEYFGKYPLRVRLNHMVLKNSERISKDAVFKGEYVEIPTDKSSKNVKPKGKVKSKHKVTQSVEPTTKVSVPTQSTNPTPTVMADAKPKAVSIAKPKTYDYPEGSSQALVIRSMQSGHSYLDDISLDTGLSVEVVLEVLMDFELEGVITSGFGNAYTLV